MISAFSRLSVLLIFLCIGSTQFALGQDYAEYARGHAMNRGRNNRGLVVVGALGAIFGSVAGGYVTSRKLKTKSEKEKKDLLQYMQLQDEIYRQREQQWQAEYTKLYKAYEELEKDTLERDYEEFKAPDTNNDDMISKAEFNTYVKKYLSSFPELSERDFPRFEEFDLDGDGIVSFDEWQNFLVQQKAKEAQKGKQQQGGNQAYNDLLNALYEQSNQADSFQSLQKNMNTGGKQQQARRA